MAFSKSDAVDVIPGTPEFLTRHPLESSDVRVYFSYVLECHIRSNRKLLETMPLLHTRLDRDADFEYHRIGVAVWAKGVEKGVIARRYRLCLRTTNDVEGIRVPLTKGLGEMPLFPPIRLAKGSFLDTFLVRSGGWKPYKLRKRAEGGRGVHITILLTGHKCYPVSLK